MNNVLSIDERPDRHCVVKGLSNLVCAWSPPDVGTSYHESPTSSKPLSTDRRRINVDRVSIDRGALLPARNVASVQKAGYRENVGRHEVSYFVNPTTTFNADSYNRCFRYLDCFKKGVACLRQRFANMYSGVIRSSPATPLKAVYLSSRVDRSQTRMPEGFNLRSQLGEWLCLIETTEDMISTNVRSARNMRLRDFVVICTSEMFPVDVVILLGLCEYHDTDGTTNQSNWQKSRRVPLGLNDDSGGHKAVRTKVKPRLRKRTRELTQQYRPIRPKAPRYA